MPRILASLVFVVMSLGPAWARTEKTLSYPRDQVWSTAVRFLVVDEHVKILDKDADTGYVLFELIDEKKPYRGSLEVMTVQVDGRPQVRFVLHLVDRPSWLELAMLTRLERKVRVELGSPTPPPTKPKEPPKDDGQDKQGDGKKDDSAKKDDAKKDDPKDKSRVEGGVRISPTP